MDLVFGLLLIVSPLLLAIYARRLDHGSLAPGVRSVKLSAVASWIPLVSLWTAGVWVGSGSLLAPILATFWAVGLSVWVCHRWDRLWVGGLRPRWLEWEVALKAGGVYALCVAISGLCVTGALLTLVGLPKSYLVPSLLLNCLLVVRVLVWGRRVVRPQPRELTDPERREPILELAERARVRLRTLGIDDSRGMNSLTVDSVGSGVLTISDAALERLPLPDVLALCAFRLVSMKRGWELYAVTFALWAVLYLVIVTSPSVVGIAALVLGLVMTFELGKFFTQQMDRSAASLLGDPEGYYRALVRCGLLNVNRGNQSNRWEIGPLRPRLKLTARALALSPERTKELEEEVAASLGGTRRASKFGFQFPQT